MREKFFLCAVLLFTMLFPRNVAAQPPRGADYHYEKGVELYEHKMYGAAEAEFRKAVSLLDIDDQGKRMRSRYYIALCSARDNQSNADELLERFLEDYPNSIYRNDIHFALGLILEKKGNYEAAYTHFLTVNPYELNFSQYDEYYYRTGYAAYRVGNVDQAYTYFQYVTNDEAYIPHATYYRSYIDYTRGNLEAAKAGFTTIASFPAYEPIIPFYLLQIEFQEGNYGYVISNGPSLLEKATESRKIEISRILSESYFHQRDYAEALRYIQLYEELGGRMGREELYLAGFSNYNQHYYSRAIPQLAEAASTGDDEMSQNAYFHLADSYLQTGDKRNALSAFALAAAGNENMAVKEEAMFNYGKLQYELGGGAFNEAITILAGYVKRFPNSPRIDEAQELLLAAYFNSRNYEAAYEAVKSIRNPDNNVKTAMQKIAYFRALEFYEQGDYTQAIAFFNIADANRFNAKYTALTRFWRAETLMQQQHYSAAVPLYKEYITLSPRTEYENQVAHYNLGYAYFNLKNWSEAGTYFQRFLESYTGDDNLKADTYNRLGDVAFAQRNYGRAIENYDQAIRMGAASADYARYQRAIMLGLNGNRNGKIESLLSIISADRGNYVDDAMFELGRTYLQADRYNDAANVLRNLTNRYPDSPLYLPALAQLGLTYQNLGNDDEALRYYKLVVEKFPNSREAKDAMLGIRNIYVDRNQVDSYFTYARQAGVETDVSVVERDSLSFAAAERIYQAGNCERTLSAMDNYLRQYPRGAYRADALYALGDCSIKEGNPAAGLSAFEEIAGMPNNRYTVQALQRAAKMHADAQNHETAAALYHQLIGASNRSTVSAEALGGFLRETGATGNQAAMAAAADEVLASSFAGPELIQQANFIKAKIFQQQGDLDNAVTLYRTVKSARTAEGAESRYQIADILRQQGKLKEAQTEVFEMAEQNIAYQYWMGKAFLVLGDIYVQQDDLFQAKATYQSIIDGYADKTDGIVGEAQQKLNALNN